MVLKQKVILFIWVFGLLFFLLGCQQNFDNKTDQNSNAIIDYEYLSLDGEYSNEINNWLNKVRNDTDEDLNYLSLDNGKQYVYGRGYNKAKVSYTYEGFDGEINRSIKATLLKGENSEEIFIRITSDTDVDEITLDVTDDKKQF
ncbi:hypothetical protein BN1058_02373 [Paraliobacillus sp. PM-2]|uniref:hypothetical protein n=1 Tax=Paraliobacillus sp. PM-2 TaxID=1462524 RepID=UPI00061C2E39|nr:hypothetical protein [Paraliobacillus sp. PM-2]CQR48031.1 hypothetical protein BN1058_02373 [Paraliobacillus sp. PM-2]